ncbi:hypothetical protein ACFL6C_08105 [Myxococcota bacterium]
MPRLACLLLFAGGCQLFEGRVSTYRDGAPGGDARSGDVATDAVSGDLAQGDPFLGDPSVGDPFVGDPTAGSDSLAGDPGFGSDVDGGDAWSPGDPDLDEALAVFVPPGVRACASGSIQRDVLGAVLDMKARVAFVPGYVVLPRDQTSFPADWIASVEVGREATQLSSASPGEFVRTVTDGTPDDGTHQFVFTQGYDSVEGAVTVVITMTFEVVGGEPVEQVLRLDDMELANGRTFIRVERPSVTSYLGTCLFSPYSCSIRQFTIANGDSLRTETCRYCPPMYICKADAGGMRRAEILTGGTQRFMDDYFDLSHSHRHHNWGEDLLIMLDAPVGPVYGIYLGWGFPGSSTFEQVEYLDDDLGVVETHEISSFETIPDW